MQQSPKPSKEVVRIWLSQEIDGRRPPPTPDRIREMLGWKLTEKGRSGRSQR
jgi:hypothetical protein